jgi:type IV pilus assembly protein PilO
MNIPGLTQWKPRQINQWPMKVKISLILGVSLIIIVWGYELIIRKSWVQYHHLKAKEFALKSDFENKQKQIVSLFAYRNQLKVIGQRFVSMLKQLPEKNEMPGLLEEISKTGVASGLKFELFAPQTEKIHEFYVELPINISVVGSYFQLASFLSRIAQMNRIVTLNEFSVERRFFEKTSENKLVMNFKANIYRYSSHS